MRVNIYTEEITSNIELINKMVDGKKLKGVRFYLQLQKKQEEILTDKILKCVLLVVNKIYVL